MYNVQSRYLHTVRGIEKSMSTPSSHKLKSLIRSLQSQVLSLTFTELNCYVFLTFFHPAICMFWHMYIANKNSAWHITENIIVFFQEISRYIFLYLHNFILSVICFISPLSSLTNSRHLINMSWISSEGKNVYLKTVTPSHGVMF